MKRKKKLIVISLIIFLICIGILYFIKIKIFDKSSTSTSTLTTTTSPKIEDEKAVEETVVEEDDVFDTSIQGRHRDFSGPIPIYGMIAPDGSFRSAPPQYKSPQPYLTESQRLVVGILIDPMLIHGVLWGIFKSSIISKTGTLIKQLVDSGPRAALRLIFSGARAPLLLKVGLIAGKKASEVFTRILASKIATRIGTMMVTAAASGPAAPVVFAAEVAFAGLSIGLDVADVGGYGQMKTNNMLVDYKKEYDKQFMEGLKNEEGPYKLKDYEIPFILGPDYDVFFKSMTEEEQNAFIEEAFRDLFFTQDPLVQPLINKVIEDLNNPNIGITLEELEQNQGKIASYMKILDEETISKCIDKIKDVYCIQNNGKIFERPDKRVCSYKNKKTCDESYTWPINQEEDEDLPKDMYAEYREELADGEGACVLASPLLRNHCELAELDYNTSTGLCTVNEKYCKKKGSEWKDDDCYISPGQDALEMIFGTTIVRGLKQVFDLDQYETCTAPEYEPSEWLGIWGGTSWLRYFCMKKECDDGHEEWGGFCYPKCKDGYKNDGCCFCSPIRMGLPPVRHASQCPSGYHMTTIGLCQESECGPGEYMSTPGFCTSSECPKGYHNSTPGFCFKDCDPDYEGDTWGMCKRKCTEDYHNVAGVCWAKVFFKDKYSREWGKGFCHPHGCCKGPEYCPNDDKHWESACYCGEHYCKEGWSDKWGKGGLHNYCYKDCPAGWLDDGISCRIYKDIKDLSYVVNYPKESIATTRPIKVVPASCTNEEMQYPGDLLCYAKCEEGWEQSTVGYCTLKGTKGYHRGSGYAMNTLRPKKRIIDYGTKDNIEWE